VHFLNIGTNYNFLRSVHKFIDDNFGNDENICDVLLLLPNRRSVSALRTVFLENVREDGAKILPAIRALGDLDEGSLMLGGADSDLLLEYLKSPRTTSDVGYRLLLLREILLGGDYTGVESAIGLLGELEALLADMENYGVGFDSLSGLVNDDLAIHWQRILDFRRGFGDRWRKLLDENHLASIEYSRITNIRFYERAVGRTGPKNPVVMIGNFEPTRSVLDLTRTLSRYDNTYIIFKGLESVMTEEEFGAIDETNSHFSIKKILDELAIGRESVIDLKYPDYRTVGDDSLHTIYTAMLPPSSTHRWQNNAGVSGLDHIQYVECRDICDELNLIMVYLLDHSARNGLGNVAIVANQELSQRLELLLKYWNIPFNNAYGKKFLLHAVAKYLLLLVEVYNENYRANKLLSLLKNNFVRFGYREEELSRNIELFEKHILYDKINRNGIESYRIHLSHVEDEQARENLTEFLDRIENYFSVFNKEAIPLEDLILGHLRLAERIASSEEIEGADILWRRDRSHEKIFEFLQYELLPQSKHFGDSRITDYGYILNFLLSEKSYSEDYSLHPAVNIISVQEAQLINYDLVIVANLNDGVNPPNIVPDPWMSRKMRVSLGLPPREMEIGRSYFGLVQLVAQNRVLLTRSRNVDGIPSIKSRFLQRLETTLRCNGFDLRENRDIVGGFRKYYSFEYDRRNDVYRKRPQPKPPVDTRPKGLSATNIDLLNLNPYDVYAKKILALAKTNPMEMNNIHAKIGTILHSIFERYSRDYDIYGHGDHAALADLVRGTLDYHFANDRLPMELYFDRVLESLRQFVVLDKRSRDEGYSIVPEDWNSHTLDGKNSFTISARVDRLEKLNDSLRIVDYKTGTAPSKSDVVNGRRLQLLVEALIMSRNRPGTSVISLQYWLIKQKNGDVQEISDGNRIRDTVDPISLEELVSRTEEFLVRLFNFFSSESNGYVATNRNSRYSDFNHLSRLEEWLYGERMP
jgi:ATP-dependent helicase/nuclease subunit B